MQYNLNLWPNRTHSHVDSRRTMHRHPVRAESVLWADTIHMFHRTYF